MGKVRVRYYTTRTYKGRKFGYWQPTARMKEQGFGLIPCGPDGPDAWAKAEECNWRWDASRSSKQAPRWPAGSLGAAFDALRLSRTWAEKQPRTREDWQRGWRYIEGVFGDVRPGTVTFPEIDDWYAEVLASAGVREAWRAMKIWRALWNVAAAMRLCVRDSDPSKGVRRKTPKTGTGIWREGEIVRHVKAAWRSGYPGLACIIAVAWDGALAPVDTRKLRLNQMVDDGQRIRFDIARAKTGRAAMVELCPRATRLVRAYLAILPPDQLPSAMVFRNRSGRPYSKDTLGDDFRMIRGAGETRTLARMRASAGVEAIGGGASAAALASKLANSLHTNEDLHRAYNPVDLGAVRLVDKARIASRRKARESD